MRVLVTGSDGYIGSLLGPMLMQRGHDVVGLDTGFFRNAWLYNGVHAFPPCISTDIREITGGDLEGFNAVVHLAELDRVDIPLLKHLLIHVELFIKLTATEAAQNLDCVVPVHLNASLSRCCAEYIREHVA